MTKLVFLDTETTGLDPDRHEIWEVGAIVVEDSNNLEVYREYTWQLPIKLAEADLIALNIGRFHERRLPNKDLTWKADFCDSFQNLTWGATIIGAVPSFDCERLFKLLRLNHCIAAWHYHLVDIEAVAIGYLRGTKPDLEIPLPYSSSWLANELGIVRNTVDRHTALGDAREVFETWKELMT